MISGAFWHPFWYHFLEFVGKRSKSLNPIKTNGFLTI